MSKRGLRMTKGLAKSAMKDGRNPHLAGFKSEGSKMGNLHTRLEGYTFDSIREAERYTYLNLRLLAKEITRLAVHPRFPLFVNDVKIGWYEADFLYKEIGNLIVEDVKSEYTRKLPLYQMKKALMKAVYGIEVQEIL